MTNRLEKLRKQKGLTLKELALDLVKSGYFEKITDATLSNYENEKREPKLETWVKLSEYFGYPVAYINGTISDDFLELQQLFNKMPEPPKMLINGKEQDISAKTGSETLDTFLKINHSSKWDIEGWTPSDASKVEHLTTFYLHLFVELTTALHSPGRTEKEKLNAKNTLEYLGNLLDDINYQTDDLRHLEKLDDAY